MHASRIRHRGHASVWGQMYLCVVMLYKQCNISGRKVVHEYSHGYGSAAGTKTKAVIGNHTRDDIHERLHEHSLLIMRKMCLTQSEIAK